MVKFQNQTSNKAVVVSKVTANFLSTSSTASLGRALASRNHFFLSPDFHELWQRVMTICLLSEVTRQWARLVLAWVTVSVRDQLWDVSKLDFLSATRLS